jgi:basic membrane lipoprotein Med (substrate-binding protein (PBP1-ABC) superfamily)
VIRVGSRLSFGTVSDRDGTPRALAAAGLLVVLALLSACDPGGRGASDADLRVALLTPGSIRDGGWNQGAYEGLLAVRDELGAEVAHQETRTPQEFESGFRDFAARGYELVFGHGFEFQDAATRVAAEFPDTVFITTSGSTIRPNVAPIVFELEQATYVLGYVAARVSQRAQVGAIGGMKIPPVESTFLAFEAGAREGRPDVRVSTSYIGSWEDVSAAREATLAQMAQGVDVLIHNVDDAAPGFFQAVAADPGVFAFGTNRNQNGRAPDSVLASGTLDIPRALLLVAREVQSGRFRPRSIRFGLRDGVVAIEWNDALRSRLPDPVRADADALAERIRSGQLEVPRAGF